MEEFVIHKTLKALTALTELGLLQKPILHEMLADIMPFFCHPVGVLSRKVLQAQTDFFVNEFVLFLLARENLWLFDLGYPVPEPGSFPIQIALVKEPGTLNRTASLSISQGVWIRQGAVGFVVAVAKSLNVADVHCNLVPLVQPFLSQPVMQIDSEVMLMPTLTGCDLMVRTERAKANLPQSFYCSFCSFLFRLISNLEGTCAPLGLDYKQ